MSFSKDIKKEVLPILFVVLLIFGLIMLQPDFGTGIIIVMTIITILFVSGVKMNFFIKIGVAGLLGIVGLIIIAPYRLKRIGVQGTPGLLMCINGEQIQIGKSGIFEINIDYIVSYFGVVIEKDSDKVFLLDYQY